MIKSINLDKFAIFLSGVCLVHCLIMPILMTVLPIFTINALIDDAFFHKLMLWFVLPTSISALFIGCRKHRDWLITGSGIIGMLILIAVAVSGHALFGENYEKIATSVGGIILAYSHYLNFKACQNLICESKNCVSEHHH